MALGHFWTEVIRHKKTFWRATLYEFTKRFFANNPTLQSSHNVLELGGSIKASHQRALPESWRMSYADQESGPNVTHVFDANGPFPIEDGAYDGSIAYNTALHIRDLDNMVQEMLRVSKTFVLFTIPFVAPIAHHPVDWHRLTEAGANAYCQTWKERGLIDSFEVLPIGNMFGCVANILDLINKFRITRVPAYALCRLGDRWIASRVKTTCPMQFLIYMKK